MPTLPFTGDGSDYDVTIGGVPFRLATSSDLPAALETVAVSKDQFDTERDPGEQSLSGYWRRSQSSFHSGAGYLYEPTTTDEDFTGFWGSRGVDVFTRGEVTLIRRMIQAPTQPATFTRISCHSQNFSCVTSAGVMHSGDGLAFAVLNTPPAGHVYRDVKRTSGYSYGITDTGRLYKIDNSLGTGGYWALTLTGTPADLQVDIGKFRAWVISDRDIFQPNVNVATDDGAAPIAPIFTNPIVDWKYTCMTEGPAAMYFGGHDGKRSSIQMIKLTDTGALPTLSGAITACVLPDGERVTNLATVGGQYIGIGTNLGFRVGRMESDGSITYGPLILTDRVSQDVTSSPPFLSGCRAITSHGDSFYVALADNIMTPCVYRVNTAFELGTLDFPYARDVEMDSGGGNFVTDLDVYFDSTPRLAATTFSTSGTQNFYLQTRYWPVASGYVQTSRIRYNTTEAKAFKWLTADIKLNADNSFSSTSIDIIPSTGSTLTGAVCDTAAECATPIAMHTSPLAYCSLKINLATTVNDGTEAPTFYSFLVRALPAAKPQRLITLPLLCFDTETGRTGQTYSYKGWARQRLEALQAFEDTVSTLTYVRNETSSNTLSVVIDSLQFVQNSPAYPYNNEGAGGILIVKMKTVPS